MCLPEDEGFSLVDKALGNQAKGVPDNQRAEEMDSNHSDDTWGPTNDDADTHAAIVRTVARVSALFN